MIFKKVKLFFLKTFLIISQPFVKKWRSFCEKRIKAKQEALQEQLITQLSLSDDPEIRNPKQKKKKFSKVDGIVDPRILFGKDYDPDDHRLKFYLIDDETTEHLLELSNELHESEAKELENDDDDSHQL